MNNFKNRAAYFELEEALEEQTNFVEKIKAVRLVSNWAAEQLGYDIHETEEYARSHISDIVRENEVAKMIRRIHQDLLNHNIDTDSDIIIHSSQNLLKNFSEKIKKSSE